MCVRLSRVMECSRYLLTAQGLCHNFQARDNCYFFSDRSGMFLARALATFGWKQCVVKVMHLQYACPRHSETPRLAHIRLRAFGRAYVFLVVSRPAKDFLLTSFGNEKLQIESNICFQSVPETWHAKSSFSKRAKHANRERHGAPL